MEISDFYILPSNSLINDVVEIGRFIQMDCGEIVKKEKLLKLTHVGEIY